MKRTKKNMCLRLLVASLFVMGTLILTSSKAFAQAADEGASEALDETAGVTLDESPAIDVKELGKIIAEIEVTRQSDPELAKEMESQLKDSIAKGEVVIGGDADDGDKPVLEDFDKDKALEELQKHKDDLIKQGVDVDALAEAIKTENFDKMKELFEKNGGPLEIEGIPGREFEGLKEIIGFDPREMETRGGPGEIELAMREHLKEMGVEPAEIDQICERGREFGEQMREYGEQMREFGEYMREHGPEGFDPEKAREMGFDPEKMKEFAAMEHSSGEHDLYFDPEKAKEMGFDPDKAREMGFDPEKAREMGFEPGREMGEHAREMGEAAEREALERGGGFEREAMERYVAERETVERYVPEREIEHYQQMLDQQQQIEPPQQQQQEPPPEPPH